MEGLTVGEASARFWVVSEMCVEREQRSAILMVPPPWRRGRLLQKSPTLQTPSSTAPAGITEPSLLILGGAMKMTVKLKSLVGFLGLGVPSAKTSWQAEHNIVTTETMGGAGTLTSPAPHCGQKANLNSVMGSSLLFDDLELRHVAPFQRRLGRSRLLRNSRLGSSTPQCSTHDPSTRLPSQESSGRCFPPTHISDATRFCAYVAATESLVYNQRSILRAARE
jgi:hypothetical protein